MKHFIKIFLIMTVTLMSSISIRAYDFEVDGIRYDITSFTELTVTASSLSESFEGFLNIPSFVDFNGKKLIVKNIGNSFAENNDKISDIVVNDSILTIGDRAFYNCSQINTITLKGVNNIKSECFKQCTKLSKIEMPVSLNSIGDGAFEKCELLQELLLPEQTKQIGANAFKQCSSLENISLLNVAYINKNTFSDCVSLRNITLSNNLTYIGSHAFSNTAIETFIIPDSVTELGESILSDCSNLKSLTIGKGITILSSNPIANCPNIYELVFKDSDTPLYIAFGSELFFYHETKYSYVYSAGFEDLGISQLYMGRNVYPFNYTDWQDDRLYVNPFMGNKNIRNVVIGKQVTNLPVNHIRVKKNSGLIVFDNTFGYFEGCDSLQNVQMLGNLENISDRMFYGTKIEEISTPQSISSIGSFAFANCMSLKKISIGKNCKIINTDAFSNDEALSILNLFCVNPPEYSSEFENSKYVNLNVNIPPNTINEYKNAEPWSNFWNMQEDENLLTTFNIDPFKFELINNNNEVELIGLTDLDLEKLDIPSTFNYNQKDYNVTELSFQGTILKNCVEVILPNTVTSIPTSIFKNWVKLEKINMGNIKLIPDSCFYNCNSLNNITIPECCISVGSDAFNGCSSLSEISIPGNCISIGNDAFNGCSKLSTLFFEASNTPIILGINTSLNLSSSITPHPNPSDVDERRSGFRNGYYDGLFYGLPIERLVVNRDIELSKYYERILGSSTSSYSTVYNDIVYYPPFYGLQKLKYVEIGENVSAICKNQIDVVLNAEKATMNFTNFGQCNNIEVVVSNNPTAPIGGGFTKNVYDIANLFLPNGGIDSYKSDDYWKCFSKIKETSYIPVESLSLNWYTVQLKVGEAATLTASVLPEDVTDKTVTWTSSNESVVKVDDQGIISALSIGEAEVIASCGGASASCLVTVTPVLAETLTISPESWNGEEGESFIIEAKIEPENTTDKTLSFESDDENVAVVDQNGKVTVLKEGTCVITISTLDGSNLTAKCLITGLAGIELVNDGCEKSISGRYDISGSPVNEDFKGFVIVRFSDGSTKKTLQK